VGEDLHGRMERKNDRNGPSNYTSWPYLTPCHDIGMVTAPIVTTTRPHYIRLD
jgi:hypothetical protein